MILPEFDQETVLLVPDKIMLSTDTELTQYFIKEWHLNLASSGNFFILFTSFWMNKALNIDNPNLGVKMQIIFKRRLTNEVLTTYLPTILLIIIGYCTTFFKPFFFEAALTVNLTTMLVMTTIFISVMEKLPPTSYIRMVDIWLIFGILIPFLEVSILTFKEYNNEEDLMFNHHGRVMEIQKVCWCVKILTYIFFLFDIGWWGIRRRWKLSARDSTFLQESYDDICNHAWYLILVQC